MGSVTIGSNTYQIYGTQTESVSYLGGSLATQAIAFVAATADSQARALVTATRLLDRQNWQGSPVGVPAIDTVLQWPRTNVIDGSGAAVSSATVPDALVKGCYELAAILLVRPSLQDQANADPQVAAVSGGGTSVTMFKHDRIGRLPKVVQELVSQFFAGAVYQVGSLASGTNDTNSGDSTTVSAFDDVDRYGLTRGV